MSEILISKTLLKLVESGGKVLNNIVKMFSQLFTNSGRQFLKISQKNISIGFFVST
jgi:hypothetical protein